MFIVRFIFRDLYYKFLTLLSLFVIVSVFPRVS